MSQIDSELNKQLFHLRRDIDKALDAGLIRFHVKDEGLRQYGHIMFAKDITLAKVEELIYYLVKTYPLVEFGHLQYDGSLLGHVIFRMP